MARVRVSPLPLVPQDHGYLLRSQHLPPGAGAPLLGELDVGNPARDPEHFCLGFDRFIGKREARGEQQQENRGEGRQAMNRSIRSPGLKTPGVPAAKHDLLLLDAQA